MKIVKIPKTLLGKLKPFGPRFLKVRKPVPGVRKSGKGAVENGWQFNLYEADNEKLQRWLQSGGNYGISFGEGIAGIDLDSLEMRRKLEEHVDTFTIQSGRGPEGLHAIIRTDATENGVILTPEGKNLGNIQVKNKYLVGPGCNHFTGGTYKIIKDVPFVWVSKAELEEIFGESLKWTGERRKLAEEQAKHDEELMGFKIPMGELVDLNELRQISEYEWQGAHPIHGSTTGVNFCVNKIKNCWHCFRCNSGGGPLLWLAVQHGLLQCHEAQKGVLRGKLFLKVLKIAREEGYDIKPSDKEEKISPNVSKYFEGKPPHFVPAYLADELLKKFRYLTRESDETVFIYHPKKGTHTPNGEAHIKRKVKEILGKYASRYRSNEVLFDIKCSTLTEIKDTPPHLIALKNGILNLKTGKLEKFTPNYFILNALPVKYDPQADCPKIKKFVSEIVDESDVPVLQEIAGYCLLRDHSIHKAFMFIGEGANGKSTFMELLRAMLGNENVATEALQEFERNRFSVSNLYGKLANIYPDLTDRALRSTGLFKILTGGDTISGEYKFKDRFSFRNYAKLLFSANKIPECKDDTTAFFRRWIIINFPHQFLSDNPKTDKNLIKKLTTEQELSGFLNWALEGLTRLLKSGKFSYAKSVEETREQYIRASDPVKAFAMDCIKHKPGSVIPKDEVYNAFIEYCQKMKLPTVAKNAFSGKLPEHVSGVQSGRRTIRGKRITCWIDIQLTTNEAKNTKNSIDFYTSTERAENKKNKKNSSREVRKPMEKMENLPPDTPLEEFHDIFERETINTREGVFLEL